MKVSNEIFFSSLKLIKTYLHAIRMQPMFHIKKSVLAMGHFPINTYYVCYKDEYTYNFIILFAAITLI